MSAHFPSTAWFQRLADRMAAQPEKYRRFGGMDLVLIPRIIFPDGQIEEYRLVFKGQRCVTVEPVTGEISALPSPHTVILAGEERAWREMVENIETHGGADLEHTLNYLTLPDWPFRLLPVDEEEGQLDVDRFYRYIETLQEFFNEAGRKDARPAA
jgi:hypothetical protein